MNFTSELSLATAILELTIAIFLFLKYKKSFFVKFASLFIVVLSFYQFSEFMLCTTRNIQFWGKVGFIAYTFLPAMGLHFVLSYTKNSFNKHIIYIPLAVFALIAAANINFIVSGSCLGAFVSIKNYFYSLENFIPTTIYWFYYISYILIIAIYLYLKILKTRSKTLVLYYLLIMLTALLTIFAPLILLIVFSNVGYQFPSIYCQFGVAFPIVAIWGSYLDDKMKHRFKYFKNNILKKIRF